MTLNPVVSCRDLLKKLVQQGATTDVLVDYPPMSVLQQGYLPNVHIEDYHKVYKNKTISPLINAIIQHYPYEFIQVLLKKASPNFADSEGMTPLMHAVQSVSQRVSFKNQNLLTVAPGF